MGLRYKIFGTPTNSKEFIEKCEKEKITNVILAVFEQTRFEYKVFAMNGPRFIELERIRTEKTSNYAHVALFESVQAEAAAIMKAVEIGEKLLMKGVKKVKILARVLADIEGPELRFLTLEEAMKVAKDWMEFGFEVYSKQAVF